MNKEYVIVHRSNILSLHLLVLLVNKFTTREVFTSMGMKGLWATVYCSGAEIQAEYDRKVKREEKEERDRILSELSNIFSNSNNNEKILELKEREIELEEKRLEIEKLRLELQLKQIDK